MIITRKKNWFHHDQNIFLRMLLNTEILGPVFTERITGSSQQCFNFHWYRFDAVCPQSVLHHVVYFAACDCNLPSIENAGCAYI